MEKESLEKARKQLVAKRNDLVQNARQPLTKIQNEVIQYMVSKVKPTDPPGTRYTFKCSEFYELMGYVTTSYTDIKALLSEIKKVNWWIDAEVDGEDDKNLSWFNIVHANPKKETVTISFHEDIEPYIFQLVESKMYFSSYPFQYISLMKSFYSQKLYEQLNTHKYDKPRPGRKYPDWTYEIGTGGKQDLFIRIAQAAPELDQRVRWDRKEKKTKVITKYDGYEPGEPMIPESWRNFAFFKRDVLEPAIREINTYTDMMVMYEPLKTDLAGNRYRRYTSIRFSWILKSEGQIEDTEKLIDKEYQRIEEARAGHQYTLDELYGLQTQPPTLEERMDRVRLEQENFEKNRIEKLKIFAEEAREKEVEERCEKSAYSLSVGEFGKDFTDEQLEFLFKASFENLPPGKINISFRDMWLTDYISHYKKKIDATNDDTRTTTYNRLLDMLRRDYDKVGDLYAERYCKMNFSDSHKKRDMSKSMEETVKAQIRAAYPETNSMEDDTYSKEKEKAEKYRDGILLETGMDHNYVIYGNITTNKYLERLENLRNEEE